MKASKRRGAVKVPNVILRPAQASSSRSNLRQATPPRVALSDDDTTEETLDLTTGSKPLHGIVLCATGDVDKRTLFARAQDLGAVRSNDFTDQVTHLVADAAGSAKYKCAVERNLPILKATWIEEAHNTWLNGGIVDLKQTIYDHRLPVFSGVKLCITGMEDVKIRNKIHQLLAKEGGVYLKSLDATATHLLSCASESSAKMKWARDYNRMHLANPIRIIWEEWLWDCIEFGGRWDESEYDVSKARPARKAVSRMRDVIYKSSSTLPTATLSQRAPLPRSIPTHTLLGDDPPEYGRTRKQRGFGLQIVENLIKMRNHVKSDNNSQNFKNNDSQAGLPVTSSRVFDLNPQYGSISNPKPNRAPLNGVSDCNANSNSVLTRLSRHRATSFARTSSPQPQSRQPFRRILSSSTALPAVPANSSDSVLFAGYKFRALGEARGSSLREALESNGGQWLDEDDEQCADFILVRLVSGGLFWKDEEDESERAKFRTDCWIERCIYAEKICDPNEHITFTPLSIDIPVEGSENLHVSLSGLEPSAICWTKRLVRAIGGNIPTIFSRRSTHLICPSGHGMKYDKAKEWGVSVVGLEWLFTIATTGKIPPAHEFEVAHNVGEAAAMLTDKVDHGMDVKGKGKATMAVEEDGLVAIIDITNGASPNSQPPVKRAGTTLDCKESAQASKSPTPAIRVVDSGPGLVRQSNPLLLVTSPELSRTTTKIGSTPPSRFGHSSRSPWTTPKGPQATRKRSAAEIEQDKQTTRIPSSHSPSPLRAPTKTSSMTSPPISETGGLRTAITALLGKRNMEARQEVDRPQRLASRSSKRPRPPSKAKTDLGLGRGLSPALTIMNGSPPFTGSCPHDGPDVFLEERQSSLRVIYEDPVQRAEKRKLIAMFDTPGSGDEKGAGKEELPRTDGDTEPVSKRRMLRRSSRSLGV